MIARFHRHQIFMRLVFSLTAVVLCCALRAQVVVESDDIDESDEFAITPDSILLHPEAVEAENLQKLVIDAQPVDSLAQVALDQLQQPFVPDPIRAMWLSLILPGAGQIYNHKYWKLPIIYGGFLGCAYALSWNNQMLRDYSQAYLDIMDSDPNTNSYEKMLPMGYDISGREAQFQEIFKNKKNYYRKYRDMSIFAFAAVYIIAVIDAYVDAELSTFDISRDLSMRLQPAVISTEHVQIATRHHNALSHQSFGLALRLPF